MNEKPKPDKTTIDFTTVWTINGLYHNEDGPAVTGPKKEEYYLDGKRSCLILYSSDRYNRSKRVCRKCEFFVDSETKRGWKWRRKVGVSVLVDDNYGTKSRWLEFRQECARCPRILEHTVMLGVLKRGSCR
jgi:hypothetical protein